MRSIEHRFAEEVSKQPVSSLIAFSIATTGQNYSIDRLQRAFGKLVNKSDYSKGDKVKILETLYRLNSDTR